MTTNEIAAIRMRPPHPGAFIRNEVLEPLGLNVSRGAEALGVRRATLSDLVNSKSALSPEIAFRVEKAFGVDMETMLTMQAWFDTCAMRDRADEIDVARYVTPGTDARRP